LSSIIFDLYEREKEGGNGSSRQKRPGNPILPLTGGPVATQKGKGKGKRKETRKRCLKKKPKYTRDQNKKQVAGRRRIWGGKEKNLGNFQRGYQEIWIQKGKGRGDGKGGGKFSGGIRKNIL